MIKNVKMAVGNIMKIIQGGTEEDDDEFLLSVGEGQARGECSPMPRSVPGWKVGWGSKKWNYGCGGAPAPYHSE